jgi:hypothetical protein
MHEGERPVAPRHRAQHGQRDGVIAPHRERDDARGNHRVQLALDGLEGLLDRNRRDVDVAIVGHAEPLEGRDLEHGVPRPDQRGLIADVTRAVARTGR